jgi:hypothetical protein
MPGFKIAQGAADTTSIYGEPGQVDLLLPLLDVANLPHQAIAQNIANVNTPG